MAAGRREAIVVADEAHGERIASLAELPEEGTFLFRVEPTETGVDVEREAILVRTDGAAGPAGDGQDGGGEDGDGEDGDWGVEGSNEAVEDGNRGGENRDGGEEAGLAAWLNYCQHFTHIKLDKGGGAPIRNGEILCTNHGAMFESDTGRCTHGPCEGAYLTALDVRVDDGEVYLDDPAYAFVGLGPMEGKIGDLSSTSNVEF